MKPVLAFTTALFLGSLAFASYGSKQYSNDSIDSTFAVIIELVNELKGGGGDLTRDLQAIADDLKVGSAELSEPEVSDLWRIESSRGSASSGSTYLLPLWAGYKANSWIVKYLKITVEVNDATGFTTIVIDKFVNVTIEE